MCYFIISQIFTAEMKGQMSFLITIPTLRLSSLSFIFLWAFNKARKGRRLGIEDQRKGLLFSKGFFIIQEINCKYNVQLVSSYWFMIFYDD